ncbi:hypothetical protein [Aquihabitans sp. McL0605]|uniref:hypothetical protein n=1 Tax=Aquihabitans sp. McL0605 TaxID=3415671 RepID=UPI003CF3420F
MDHQDQDAADEADQIRLTVPALAPYSRVARLAVTALASRNGFTYLEVEDLRVAIGELFGALVEPADADGHLVFSCRLRPDALEVVASREPPLPLAEVTALTRMILDAVVDEVEIDRDGGRFRIVKRLED